MDPVFVFIASSSYSGSTLLSRLLGAHPQIATVSDVSGARRAGRMSEFRCSCGQRMLECRFWWAIRDQMHARGHADFALDDFRLGFDQGRRRWQARIETGSLRWFALEEARDRLLASWPPFRRRMAAIADRNVDFARSVLEVTGRQIFLDASKERMRARYLARYLPLELRVIHLVRDVRGFVASARRHPRHAQQPAGAAARAWARTNAAILRNLRLLAPERQMLVRYEELCAEPEPVLAALEAFCGADPRLATMATDGSTQHLLGNRVRLGAPAEIRLDERWRTELAEADLTQIDGTANGMMDRLYRVPAASRSGAPAASGASREGEAP